MSYNSKNLRALAKVFAEQVDQTFVKVLAKDFVKLARMGEVISTRGPPILKELSFKFCH